MCLSAQNSGHVYSLKNNFWQHWDPKKKKKRKTENKSSISWKVAPAGVVWRVIKQFHILKNVPHKKERFLAKCCLLCLLSRKKSFLLLSQWVSRQWNLKAAQFRRDESLGSYERKSIVLCGIYLNVDNAWGITTFRRVLWNQITLALSMVLNFFSFFFFFSHLLLNPWPFPLNPAM